MAKTEMSFLIWYQKNETEIVKRHGYSFELYQNLKAAYIAGWEAKPQEASEQGNPADLCNCGDYERHALTAGWICPVHGQQY